MNIPLVLALSIVPDLDLLVGAIDHRGPTHSLIVLALVSMPFLTRFRVKALPYVAALLQHSFLGDYLTGGSSLAWPLTSQFIGLGYCITSIQSQALEWAGFVAFTLVLFKTRDIVKLFKPQWASLLLLLPPEPQLDHYYTTRTRPSPGVF